MAGYTAIPKKRIIPGGFQVDNAGQAGEAGGVGTGHKVGNNGQLYVYVHNTGANTPSITFVALGKFRGTALTTAGDETKAFASGEEWIFGPFHPETFNDSDNNLNWYYSGSNETELKVIPFQF